MSSKAVKALKCGHDNAAGYTELKHNCDRATLDDGNKDDYDDANGNSITFD